ncbi:MAG: GlgC family sugar phosphate nucleotidyltransferase, partial [Promethearchaeota archaeon]
RINQIKGKSPNLIEPVIVKSEVIIGNNVLLGPFVIIGNYCKIEDFCELSNVIVYDNVIIGKSNKLDYCIVDENVKLPENFHGEECFITMNNKKELEVINF